jgi:hypothetical protein
MLKKVGPMTSGIRETVSSVPVSTAVARTVPTAAHVTLFLRTAARHCKPSPTASNSTSLAMQTEQTRMIGTGYGGRRLLAQPDFLQEYP